jgi:hypothetical protein
LEASSVLDDPAEDARPEHTGFAQIGEPQSSAS